MQNTQTWLIARDDTLLGVCEAIGEDFGFNPLWLRIAFSVALLWNPVAVIGIYLGVGLIVLLARLVAPDRRRAEPAEQVSGEGAAQAEPELKAGHGNDDEDLAAAA